MRVAGFSLMVGAALLAACDSYSSGPDDGDGVLSGSYTGTVHGTIENPLDLIVTFTLTEYLGTVTGTFTTDDGTAGSISGTVSGTNVTFTINQTVPCVGTFSGTATIADAGGQLIGTYSGNSPCTGAVTAIFDVTRG